MELCVKIVHSWTLLTVFAKTSNLDVGKGSEYTSEKQIVGKLNENHIASGDRHLCFVYF